MRTDAAILILAGTLAASTFAGELDRRVSQSNGREWLAYEIESQEEGGRCCGQWKDDKLVKTCTLSFPHESDERWGGVTVTDGGAVPRFTTTGPCSPGAWSRWNASTAT